MQDGQELEQLKAPKAEVKLGTLDPEKARFPLCITWTPLPGLTWMIPPIGHTGIGDTRGRIHDFAGPYTIGVDDFAFGETHKYIKLEGVDIQNWDLTVTRADKTYKGRMHNLFCDNCHSHVAQVLNNNKYQGKTNWNMVSVWWLCCTQSTYVSWSHLVWTYILWMLIALYQLYRFVA